MQEVLGTPGGLAHALQGVAHVEWHKGRRDLAIRLLEQSCEKWEESGDDVQLAGSHEELADFLRRSGRLEEARVSLEHATRLAIESGDEFTTAWCLRGWGSLLADERTPDRAARIWGATESLAHESGVSFAEMPSDYEEKVGQVRVKLGASEFVRAWSEGTAMTRKEAEQYALTPPRLT